MCVSWEGRAVLWTTVWLCRRLYPWYFECVVMYARYECRHLVGAGTVAELLVEFLTSRAVLLRSSSDSFDGVRELGRRIEVLLGEAALYFCC